MMYRDVSHAVHPHQLRDPHNPPSYYPAHENDSWASSRNPHDPRDHNGRSSRTSHLAPGYDQQQSWRSLHDSAQPVAVTHPTDDRAAEHTLKRKTPNSILAAGYDGTPADWRHGPSASKHLLMSKPEAARPVAYANSYGAYPNYARRSRGYEGTMGADGSHGASATGASSWSYQAPPPGTGTTAWFVPGQPPSLDSMLHQVPLAGYYDGVGYQSLPNVMQPMWYSGVGPTASGAQLPYGPYWPNGAFVPFRPAPCRDSRFSSQFASITLSDSNDSLAPFDDPLRRPNAGFALLPTHRIAMGSTSQHPPRPTVSHFATDSFLSRRQDSNPALFLEGLQRHRSYTPQHATHSATPPAYSSIESKPWPHDPRTNHRAESVPRPASQGNSNLHFRDRTLVWAHKIYTDLLAAANQSRRSSQPNPNTSDRRSTQTPFYPKPPNYTSISPTTLKKALPQSPTYRNDGQLRRISAGDSHGYASRWTPSMGHNSSPFQTPPYYQSNPYGSVLSYPVTLTIPGTPSPSAQAQQALDMLSRLVVESSWQWIDGMLLGGCLAYGLGDHKMAYDWYSRVLARDPNNVEGMSNLAATLAILGQFRDAEQHWIQAVKLRPSHFEAVEHLIGLLCQDQRAREAVKVIEFVESSLRSQDSQLPPPPWEKTAKHGSSTQESTQTETDSHMQRLSLDSKPSCFSGFSVTSSENGRLIALIHAKGNMLYGLGDNVGASRAFEDAIMVATGKSSEGVTGLIRYILQVFGNFILSQKKDAPSKLAPCETILLLPEVAIKTAEMAFPRGILPGLQDVAEGQARRAAVSVASNSLLSLAKIYQDGMSSANAPTQPTRSAPGVQEILALYYLSLSLQPSPSTANNVGILLAGVQQSAPIKNAANVNEANLSKVPGVVPGSGIALALAYYNYGLNLDNRHAHLYTNLGSLLKDIGQLNAAIKMYEQAVSCDGSFDIALANLANAVKDQGRISDAINYYQRAVSANSEFAEAVCGLANALNSVCQWGGRGGVVFPERVFDRWHVDETGMLVDARNVSTATTGWLGRVVTIVDKQLGEGKLWGKGVMQSGEFQRLVQRDGDSAISTQAPAVQDAVLQWAAGAGEWEGARIVRLVERATRIKQWQLYRGKHVTMELDASTSVARPALPTALAVPTAPTVLPFHTFTCPLSAEQIRKISQRNGLRISVSTLRAPWLPSTVFEPPAPPAPYLNVGYVSSDFNNHPLAHLMQSVFGFHDTTKVKAFCYATTASDKSSYREQIQREAPVFYDASAWPVDRLVRQILDDNIHILINLNGYTRGARNEVFAARPAPIQMSFMGFAGTLGAEWCDYLLADSTAVPPSTLRPHRGNVGFEDLTQDANYSDGSPEWVYGENIVFTRDTFFCCDHRQSAPDAAEAPLPWKEEVERRVTMRQELFPHLPDDAIILGNFNQLYKIEPTTFRTWLRILQNVPTAYLWLLRFPELGEHNIRTMASQWASSSVASRILFTDVAPKQEHIARARICDLFLDTPECNAHTTAADVLWSGTPLLTLPRYEYKMCSRMAASILKGALPKGDDGARAASDLIARDESDYEEKATRLARGLAKLRRGERDDCRLLQLRKMLFQGRWTSALFDTRRWVKDLEEAYWIAWNRWVDGEGGDIWLQDE
jgi:predicted O-linked N-acetylglucosamine transferase (SPINDLY family)